MTESPLDAAADRLARRLLAAHPPAHAYGRAAVAGLPPAVARVLSLGLDHTADTLAHPRSPWLDDASPALVAAQGPFAEAVRGAVRYPPEAWTEAVTTAAQVALRLLVHPADGLAAVAFDRDPAPRPAADALARVRAATPYAYLPDVAARYAERKGLDVLDRESLARLLARIERRMSDTLSPADWLALAEPLLDTVGPDGDPPGTVDAALVRAFFEARGHAALVDGLPDGPVARAALLAWLDAVESRRSAEAEPLPVEDREIPVDASPAGDDVAASETVEPETPASPADDPAEASPTAHTDAPLVFDGAGDDVERWIHGDEPVRAASEPPPVAPASDPPVTPPVTSTPMPATPAVEPSASPADDEPLWRRLARQHAASAPSLAEQSPPAEGSPLWQRFAPDGEAARPPTHAVVAPPAGRPPAAVIVPSTSGSSGAAGSLDRRVLGAAADQRDAFVAGLFGGDAAAFEATLAALDAAPTWTAATQIIARDIFHRPGVDMYGDTALAFTDAVQSTKSRA